MGRTSLFVVRSIALLPAVFIICSSMGWANPEGIGSTDVRSNRIEGIKTFPLDHDAGSMALLALRSAIDAYGFNASYQQLVGSSGAAFKFVYDTSGSYEPLRDLYPVDVLTSAAKSLGFSEAHWETGKSIEAVKDIIKREIDNGRPLLIPFITDEPYHGFFILTGYDLDQKIFYLQGARRGTKAYIEVPIPEEWDGPTASPAGWATNPIFVVGPNSGGGLKRLRAEKRTIRLGISLMKGGTLTYGGHPGEHRYTEDGGEHLAAYGMPAYDLLSSDVEHQPFAIEDEGEDRFNFGFIWRIDAQVGQLQHDRRQGALFLRLLAAGVPPDRAEDVNEIILGFEDTAEDAREFREIFWHEIPSTLTDAEGIAAYAKHSTSLVFRIWGPIRLRSELEAMGFGTYNTPWGYVLVDDSHEKRMLAKTALRSIVVRERRSLKMLEDIVDYIDWSQKSGESAGRVQPGEDN